MSESSSTCSLGAEESLTSAASRSQSTSTRAGSSRYPSPSDSMRPSGNPLRRRDRWFWSAPLGSRGSDVDHSASMAASARSEEHTSELQSLMRISYAVFCLKKKNKKNQN